MSGKNPPVGSAVAGIAGADAPIRSMSEDRLGRQPFAGALAAEIMAAPAARGYVMALTGPWGSGKTSILNMTVDALGDKATVVEFNPWMFSGTEALAALFFAEISKQLDTREAKLKSVAEKLARYGQQLLPLVSFAGAGAAVQGVTTILQGVIETPSLFQQRRDLRELLEGLDKRLVVMVDDVDRLRRNEVLDIVRLVRLVGDLPNTLYLLAFDRPRVEECLGEDDPERGRAYLDKIVQVTHDVPYARQPDIAEMFFGGLMPLLDNLPAGPFHRDDWQNIFTFVIRPLLITPRDVQRLLGSLPMTMRLVGDEVAASDLIGIDAVRVLHPSLFAAIVSVADYLSVSAVAASSVRYQRDPGAPDNPIGPMLAVAPGLAENVCRWLFPSARRYFENMHHGSEWEVTWRRKRKVAGSAVFRFYLERQLPDGVVPARAVDAALANLTNPTELRRVLEATSPDDLMDLIERMNPAIDELLLHDDLMADPARVALPVLLDLLPRLPEPQAPLTTRGSMTMMRVSLRLLRRIPDEEARATIVRVVLADTRSFSGRDVLLAVVGHRRNVGSGLVAVAAAAELEDQLRDDLIALDPGEFAKQDRIVRLAALMAETEQGKSALRALVQDDWALLALLANSVREVHSQALGAAAVDVTRVLPWDEFITWFGEAALVRRVRDLIVAMDAGVARLGEIQRAALVLAAGYATGNPPQSSREQLARQSALSDCIEKGIGDNGAHDRDSADRLSRD